MILEVDRTAQIVVRMANVNAEALIEYQFHNSGNATPITAQVTLPDQARRANEPVDLIPSIISVSDPQATILIDGQASASYISTRCQQLGCDQGATTAITGGTVAPVSTTLSLPGL